MSTTSQPLDRTAVVFHRHGRRYSTPKYKLDMVERFARAEPGRLTPKMLDFKISQRNYPERANAIGVNTLNAYFECHHQGQALVRAGLIASPGGKRPPGWAKLAGAPKPPIAENSLMSFTNSSGSLQIRDPNRLKEYTQVSTIAAKITRSSNLTPGSAAELARKLQEVIDNAYFNLESKDDQIEDMADVMRTNRSVINALSDANVILKQKLDNFEKNEQALLQQRLILEEKLKTAEEMASKFIDDPRMKAFLAGEPV